MTWGQIQAGCFCREGQDNVAVPGRSSRAYWGLHRVPVLPTGPPTPNQPRHHPTALAPGSLWGRDTGWPPQPSPCCPLTVSSLSPHCPLATGCLAALVLNRLIPGGIFSAQKGRAKLGVWEPPSEPLWHRGAGKRLQGSQEKLQERPWVWHPAPKTPTGEALAEFGAFDPSLAPGIRLP